LYAIERRTPIVGKRQHTKADDEHKPEHKQDTVERLPRAADPADMHAKQIDDANQNRDGSNHARRLNEQRRQTADAGTLDEAGGSAEAAAAKQADKRDQRNNDGQRRDNDRAETKAHVNLLR
jgi:hypothetical protein